MGIHIASKNDPELHFSKTYRGRKRAYFVDEQDTLWGIEKSCCEEPTVSIGTVKYDPRKSAGNNKITDAKNWMSLSPEMARELARALATFGITGEL
jgi:hypothetical protein